MHSQTYNKIFVEGKKKKQKLWGNKKIIIKSSDPLLTSRLAAARQTGR